jgi:hypothetical protein
MKTFASLLGVASLGVFLGSGSKAAADPVIVHEWGTFTCLQDEQGHAIGGINIDDEPVPFFVWQYANRMVQSQYSQESRNYGLPPYNADGGKGWTVGDPTVTMRLETPVIYLYPPKGQTPQSVPPLDVHVDFHGGVLSQYYPYAQTNGASLNGDIPYLEKEGVTESMTTGLTWKGVRLGSTEKPVETDDKVWTTPREIGAPVLQVKFYGDDNLGWHDIVQAEHFLFYRGVGHLDSPLKTNSSLQLMAGTSAGIGKEHTCFMVTRQNPSDSLDGYDRSWLVDIRDDGTCAFSTPDLAYKGDPNLRDWHYMPGATLNLDLTFKTKYSYENLAKLKTSMHDALVKEGLYADEAAAMLKTWEVSYFKSPGLRFFYIAPRTWVDKVLPLKITGAPTKITRVMVGRIELISDAQKATLAKLAAGPCPDLAAVKKAADGALDQGKLSDSEKRAFYDGEKPLSDLGIVIPPLVQDYLSLGRFRDALIVHEQQERPSAALAQFIKDNSLAQEKVFSTIPAAGLQTKEP